MGMMSDEQLKSISDYLIKRGYHKTYKGFFTKDNIQVDINDCDSVIEIVYRFDSHGIKSDYIIVCENEYIGHGEYGLSDVEDLDDTFTEFETEVEIIKFITSELNKMNIKYSSHGGEIDIGNIEINIVYKDGCKFPIEMKVRLRDVIPHPTLSDTTINQIQNIECKCNTADFISKFISFYEIYK